MDRPVSHNCDSVRTFLDLAGMTAFRPTRICDSGRDRKNGKIAEQAGKTGVWVSFGIEYAPEHHDEILPIAAVAANSR
jgi:hypothetical protein